LFAAFGEAIGLRKAVEAALAGASRFLHLERLRADAVLKQVFGLSMFVAPTTYARFFQGLTGQAREDAWGWPRTG